MLRQEPTTVQSWEQLERELDDAINGVLGTARALESALKARGLRTTLWVKHKKKLDLLKIKSMQYMVAVHGHRAT